MGSPDRLPTGLCTMLEDPDHTPVFSVASLWELVIKAALNRPRRMRNHSYSSPLISS